MARELSRKRKLELISDRFGVAENMIAEGYGVALGAGLDDFTLKIEKAYEQIRGAMQIVHAEYAKEEAREERADD